MAKMIIKESDIRNYVRRLIREALESEGREVLITPEERAADIAEREKMLAGLPYDRSKFPQGGKSSNLERQFRFDRGLPPIRKPKGGVTPRLIDADGNDVTPENSPEEIAARIEGRKADHREKMAKRFIKKADRESIANARGLSDEEAKNLTTDSFANDAENDPWTQKWKTMSPEERTAESERIRRERIQKNVDDNAVLRSKSQDLTQQSKPEPPKTRQYFLDRLAELKEKQAALGPHCQANDKKWNDYDYLIKDTQKIIKRYYSDKKKKSDDEENSINYDDEILNNILASGPDAEMMASEIGDDFIDPSNFKTNANDADENKYEEEEEEFDDRGVNSDFDGAKEMGFFGDDDDDDFMDM